MKHYKEQRENFLGGVGPSATVKAWHVVGFPELFFSMKLVDLIFEEADTSSR